MVIIIDSKELTFEQQVIELMKGHDGLSLILDFYDCPVELAAKHMLNDFMDKLVNDEDFRQKLKEGKL